MSGYRFRSDWSVFFFFSSRRRHTRFDCDWSSDVCSSDLDGRLEIDTAPDLPRAVRQLSGQRWDVVLAVLGEHPDDDLSWWVDTLRAATGSPRLIAVAQAPSMGLVLRAEKSGVLDVLALPLRREELVRALERVRSVVSETAVPLPLVEPHAVGPYVLVGQSPAMLDVYKIGRASC